MESSPVCTGSCRNGAGRATRENAVRKYLAITALLIPSYAFMVGVLLLPHARGQDVEFSPTAGPVAPDGTKAVVDLPISQHMRNTGGMGRRGPGTGAGLCVFTSIEMAGRWQFIRQLDGLQKYMTTKQGGGYPQKVDAVLAAFCREKSLPIPQYIQHTGGDVRFLELALHTDRIVCVTYAGSDDFYNGPISHMVCLAHLDASKAAIIDNNRPGYWVWMTRSQFLTRWRDMDGGWAVVFLNPPPPPHPSPDLVARPVETGCICGEDCKCKAGTCPNKCPVVYGQAPV